MNKFLKYSMIFMLSCLVFSCEEEYERTVLPVDIAGELTQDVPAEGGTYYLTLTYAGEVTLKSTESWCTAEYLGTASANNIKITIASNAEVPAGESGTKKRSAQVSILTFSNPAISVQLNQAGIAPPVLDKPKVVGKWLFDDPEHPGAADTGNDLVPVGNSIWEAEGPSETDKAVSIGVGSHFLAKHGIAPGGETASGDPATRVNEYTLLIDFKVASTGRYYSFMQTDLTNTSDGEIFINGDGRIGISGGYYSEPVVKPETWYRWVVTVKCGELWKQYLDGALLHDAGQGDSKMSVDSRFALDPAGVLLFADEDGEDNEIFVAATAIYDYALSADEVATLGKVSDPIQ
jgi:hypothetical protein